MHPFDDRALNPFITADCDLLYPTPRAAALFGPLHAERAADALARPARVVCAPSGVTVRERLDALDRMAAAALAEAVRLNPRETVGYCLTVAYGTTLAALGAAGGQVEKLERHVAAALHRAARPYLRKVE